MKAFISKLKVTLLASLSQFLSFFIRLFHLGNGSTWPGHIGLSLFPDLLTFFSSKIEKRVILVAGTNGKTTVTKMIKDVLEKKGNLVLHNESGANLLNGLASIFLLNYSPVQRKLADYAIFEVDEATVPLILKLLNYKNITVVFLNLFRDQLDRYGEVDNVARLWKEAVEKLEKKCMLILNADDPQIVFLGEKVKCEKKYFGIENPHLFLSEIEHATDSVYCLFCGTKLSYRGNYYSHLGDWFCTHCGIKRPAIDLNDVKSVLPGLYNHYNTLAGVLTLQSLGFTKEEVERDLLGFKPAFGRQEEVFYKNKKVKIFLAKNPVSMNESLKTVSSIKYQVSRNKKLVVIMALNDNIPDGRDVSWIWDFDLENFVPYCRKIVCTGLRASDLAVRVKYALLANDLSVEEILAVESDLKKALDLGIEMINNQEVLYILPTYSAMLQARQILAGKKIL